ncbi:MAG: glutamyl-tRNA reductase, partial [candidate division Zixibacteria bacterium]|nr:glutamyl-tRNA reductase [candidate division Zixibacteria bacterium]
MTAGNWHLVVCGINHKTSTLEQREPFQINRNEIARANAIFGNLPGVMESAIVSTCNRIEFYFASRKSENPVDLAKVFYKNFNDYDASRSDELFFTKKNKHAAEHILSVAAGIESVVLGENQIMAQLRDAYTSACAVKTAGKIIHRLFHQAFRVGKQVRTDTEMGKGACSVSSAAIELLQTKIKKLEKPSILLVGVNQMTALAAKGIRRLNYGNMIFANRTEQKAATFAAQFDSTGHPLTELPDLIDKSDILITCTGANEPIIT